MLKYTFVLIAFLLMPNINIQAEDKTNYQSIKEDTVSQAHKLMEKMSPEQLDKIIEKAKSLLPAIKKMTQEDIDKFTEKLLKFDDKPADKK